MFHLLHNHALYCFLIQKGHMGNKLSLSLFLVSLVFLFHFFYHIFLFLEKGKLNKNVLSPLDPQPGLLLDRIDPLPLPQCYGPHLLLRRLLDFLQDIVLVISIAIITGINSLVNIIPIPPLLHLEGLIKYLFDIGKEFCSPTCTIGCRKIVTCHLPTTNCTSVAGKFLLDVKQIFDKPPLRQRRRGLTRKDCK
jgi:hypothetical protein